MTYLQAIEKMDGADVIIFPGGAMFFVFIVQISNLLKTGEGAAWLSASVVGPPHAQDASGMRRIGP
jgi:hypothetical protein